MAIASTAPDPSSVTLVVQAQAPPSRLAVLALVSCLVSSYSIAKAGGLPWHSCRVVPMASALCKGRFCTAAHEGLVPGNLLLGQPPGQAEFGCFIFLCKHLPGSQLLPTCCQAVVGM